MPTKVSEYMTQKVVTAGPEMGVREAFFLMRDHSIRHLPIVGEEGELIGLISDRELRRPGWVDEAPDIAHKYELDDQLQVKDIMVNNVFCVHTYDTLSKAVKLVLEHRIGAVPVKDKTDALVGMLSAVDLLQALDDMIEVDKSMRKVKKVS